MSIGVTEEHAALAESVRRWAAKHAPMEGTREVVEADTPQRPGFWNDLAAQGLLAMHLPEAVGGAGAGHVELAIALEETAAALVPGPFLPSALLSECLLAVVDSPAAKELLPGLAEGSVVGAVALAPDLALAADGTVSGTATPVLGASLADVLLLGATTDDGTVTWFLVDAADVTTTLLGSFDATRRAASVEVAGLTPAPDRILTGLSAERVTEIAAALFAAEAAGIAAWTLDTATEYAKVREQFGRPIGYFQAVKHACADMLVRTEQARAAAWDAAVALDEDDQRPLASAVAAAVAVDAAVTNAKECIQILGGIGFTWEHDAHLYLKRALSLRQLLGGTQRFRSQAAELALGGARRELELELPGDDAAPVREEVRAFIAGLDGKDEQTQVREVADAGYAMPHWPKPWGREAGPVEQLVIEQEFAAANVPTAKLLIGGWILPSIIHHGTPEQHERWVRPTLHGEIVWCQMFSEPNAGSDLAALQTKATRDDERGGWVLNGQKVWTSLAQRAHWGLALARTNPDAPKHDGITAFVIDMQNTEGLDIRPLREITGAALFNEIFFNDVFVPDDCVVGPVDGGWKVGRTTLANERVAMSSGSSMGLSVEGVLAAVNEHVEEPDALLLDEVGHLVAEGQVLSLLGLRTTLRQLSGTDPGAASSVRKLNGVDNTMAAAELVLDLLGPAGATTEGPAQQATYMMLQTRCLSIAGGTTAVQKNVISERLLGLPRDDAK